jgi:F-type H+-transporting ATPase subunit delta
MANVGMRYAKALFDLTKNHEKVLNELHVLNSIFSKDKQIEDFFNSHFDGLEKKLKILTVGLKNTEKSTGISEEVFNFISLLIKKNRIDCLSEIIKNFENISDEENQVTRGDVKSTMPLDSEAQKRIESVVANITKRKVILSYKIDSKLLGGITAKVGGWTFEDSLDTHMKRLNEDLKRRAN